MTSQKQSIPAYRLPKLRVEFIIVSLDNINYLWSAIEKVGFYLQISFLAIAQNYQYSDFFIGDFGDDTFHGLYLGLNRAISVTRASIL